MANTLYTNQNLITSVAGYLANQFASSGWQIYFQATDVSSGIATLGAVTIVPKLPNEPNYFVVPPQTRSMQQVLIPAFAVDIQDEPQEIVRVGLGDVEFEQKVTFIIQGFVVDKVSHMAFATMLRNFFRPEFRIPIYDWEHNPTTPALIDNINTYVESRRIDTMEFPDLPIPVRYYINMELNVIFFD